MGDTRGAVHAGVASIQTMEISPFEVQRSVKILKASFSIYSKCDGVYRAGNTLTDYIDTITAANRTSKCLNGVNQLLQNLRKPWSLKFQDMG
ncbi:hypothetical protein TNCT_552311 [Trichonephila clavata]|uniref:Uncharacterized protein n=1 Tax=Trichonephila clavata TaxID=2740835 RepID=A0A8X6LXG8_TRICU|nr:hypothetical protein TNCT_552311 [Trichonephila clavata]